MSDATDHSPNRWAAFLRGITTRPGWSIKRLAEASTIHRSTIFRWLNGDTSNVTVASVRLIADAAGVDYQLALRAAGDLGESIPEDDWEVRMIRESGLRPRVIQMLIDDLMVRRQQERDRLAKQIEMLRSEG